MTIQKRDISKIYNHVLKQIKQNPGSEKTLESLIGLEQVIEEAIFDILQNYENKGIEQKDIKNTKIYKSQFHTNKELRQLLESRIMKIGTGKNINIDQLLDQMLKSLRSSLEGETTEDTANIEDIKNILKKLKINYMQIEETILPPDEIEQAITIGEGTGEKFDKNKLGYNKLGLLIELLIGQGIYTDDLYIVIGKNKENQMREDSYIYIYIPRIDKTIALNNGYGEASFIYPGFRDIQNFIKNTKTELQKTEQIEKIKFDYKNPENWKQLMINTLFLDKEGEQKKAGKKVNMKDFAQKEKQNYTQEELRKSLKDYRKEFIFLKHSERQTWNMITDKGDKISYLKLCHKLGYNEDRNILYKDDFFKKLCKNIYGEKIWKKVDRLKKFRKTKKLNDLKKILFSQKSKFVMMTTTERANGTIKTKAGNKISYLELYREFGYKEPANTLYKDKFFHRFCKDIYGEDIWEKVDRLKKIKKIQKLKYLKKLLFLQKDKFILMKPGEIQMRIMKGDQGNKITYTQLCREFGYKEPAKDLYKDKTFKSLCKKIYGKNILNEKQELLQKKEKQERKKLRELLQHQERDFILMGHNERRIRKLKLKNGEELGYIEICRRFGYTEDINMLYKDEFFNKFYKKIFNKDIQNGLKELLQNQKENFISMTHRKRQQRKIESKYGGKLTYLDLCRSLGHKELLKELTKDEIFNTVYKTIFNESIQEGLKSILQQYEIEFLFMPQKDRRTRKITFKNGNKRGYSEVCRKLGYTEKQGLLFKDNLFNRFYKEIFGKNMQEKLIEILHSQKENFINMTYTEREQRNLVSNNGKKIGYIDLCRRLGYKGHRNILYRNDFFNKLCKDIYGE